MSEFVGKEEFNNLVARVNKMEEQSRENEKLLREVDKKVDVILEKLTNAGTTEDLKIQTIDLKLQPVQDRVEKLEDSKKWLWRSIGATAIGLVLKYWIG